MIKSVLSIGFIVYMLNVFSATNAYVIENENQYFNVRNEIYKSENYLDYINAYPKIVQQLSSQKNTTELSFHFALLTECLFQLRDITTMHSLKTVVLPYTKKYNAAAHYATALLYLYADENEGKYDIVLSEINKLKPNNEIQLLKADIFLRQNRTAEAKVLFQKTILLTKDRLQAIAYNGLGSCFYIDSELDSAKVAYMHALKIYARLYGTQHTRYAQVLYNLGLIFGEKNDLKNSENYFSRAQFLYQQKLPPLHPRIAEAHATLGSLYLNKDDVETALFHFKKDKEITEKTYGTQSSEAFYAYLNCGTVYALKEDFFLAKNELETAYRISHQAYKHAHYQKALAALELSKVYKNTHQLDRALLFLNEAKQTELQLNTSSYRLIDIYYELGEVHLLLHDYKQSQQYYQQSLDCSTAELGEANTYWIDAFCGMAKNELAQHHIAEAEEHINSAEMLCTDEQHLVVNEPDYWQCRLLHFQIDCEKFKIQKPSTAIVKNEIDALKSCLALANKVKNSYYTQENKLYYNRKIDELHRTALYLLNHFYSHNDEWLKNQIWFFAQSGKANLLRARLQDFETEFSIPNEYRNAYNDIKKHIYFFEQNEQYDSLQIYQKHYAELVEHIQKKYPKYFGFRFDETIISLKEIQKLLLPNEQYISYYSDGKYYYALVTDKFKTQHFRIASTDSTDKLIQAMNTQILAQKNCTASASELFRLFFGSVALLENVIIEPTGSICNLPFDVLQNENNRYFFEEHTTVFSFSAPTYFNENGVKKETNCLAIFPEFSGSKLSPLNTELEKASIAKLNAVFILEKQYANKKTVLYHLPKCGMLHLGTHLLYDSLRPMESKLMLSKGDFLRLDEIWKLQTQAQFVCLAACKSNAGKWQQGEGLQNFAWAFEYAGAANVLTTRWNAADKATAKILSEFYRLLKDGNSKTEALRLAKLNYLKEADALGVQPYFWGHLMLYGNHDTLVLKPTFLARYWWIPVLIFIMALLGISALYTWKNK